MSMAIIPDNICDELKELFTDWAIQHSREPRESTGRTFPCKIFMDEFIIPDHGAFASSFCPDGYTSLNGHYSGNKKPEIEVLFVLKEDSVYNRRQAGRMYPEKYGTFWFDQCLENPYRIRYKRNFEAVLRKLSEDKIIHDTYSGDTPLGYMNINKRGGYGSTNTSRLRKYAETYRDAINRQICIMKPKVIVCFGCFDIMERIIDIGTSALLLDVDHPSYSRFTPEFKHVKQL